jgi:hypothetical protein
LQADLSRSFQPARKVTLVQSTPKKVEKFEDALLSQFVSNEDLRNSVFVNVGLTGQNTSPAEINAVDLSYSFIDRCYFRNVVFRDCKFIGTRIERSNFRQCQFHSCDFSYAFFVQTMLPIDSIEYMLSDRPNVSRELLRVLRANAVSVGDYESQNRCITLELKAQTEYFRRAIRQSDPYYREKYDTFWKRMALRRRAVVNYIERYFWGHGEGIGQVIGSTFAFLLSCSVSESVLGATNHSSLAELWASFKSNTVSTFLDVPGSDGRFDVLYSVVLVCARYLILGLLFSAIFRRLSHR